MSSQTKKVRIVVCGTRAYDDETHVFKALDQLTRKWNKEDIAIVTGGAEGPDKIAEQWSFKRMVTRVIFHADWQKYGKQAGMIRNSEMAKYGTHCVAFWDGESVGTRDMIRKAKKQGLKVKIIDIAEKDEFWSHFIRE